MPTEGSALLPPRPDANASGFWHAFANLLKTMIGAGILTLPYVTARAGLILSLLGLAILAYLSQAAIRLLVFCTVHARLNERSKDKKLDDQEDKQEPVADDHGGSAWKLIAQAAFGTPGWVVTCAALLGAQLGAVSAYVDFVGNSFVRRLGMTFAASRLLLWGFLTALCMLRPLRAVAWVSVLALLVYVYVFVSLGVFGLQAHHEEPLVMFDFSQLGTWFGPSVLAFECMGTALSIFESMGGRSDPKPFFSVLTWAYIVGIALYAGVAAVGYISWGPRVGEVVIHSFPKNAIGRSSEVVLGVVLALTYPIQMTPVFEVFEGGLRPQQARLCWPLVRAALVGSTVLMSVVVPDAEQMIALTGSVAFSTIGFVLPGLFYLKLKPPPPGSASLPGAPAAPAAADVANSALSVLLVVLGLVAGGWGIAATLSPRPLRGLE